MAQAREVTFVYRHSGGYRQVPANGVFGGLTTQGDFRMEFYLEAPEIPAEVRHRITEDQRLDEELSRTPAERRIVRDLQVGILMSRDQARSLADWIHGKLAEYEKLTQRD